MSPESDERTLGAEAEVEKTFEDLLEALGLLTFNYSQLELHLAFYTWIFVGGNQLTGQIMTAGLPFQALLDKFCSMFRFRIKDDAVLERLDDFRKRVEVAARRRNEYVHGSWYPSERSDQIRFSRSMAKAKGGLQHARRDLSPHEVRKAAEGLGALTEELDELMRSFPAGIVGILQGPPISE